MNKVAVIPAYEPNELLVTLVENAVRLFDKVVVVDDGSGSDYASIFESLPTDAIKLAHSINRGKGTALKTAFEWIALNYENNQERFTVVTMDSDGQHTLEDACSVCEKAAENPDSLVLGYRCFDNTPKRSRAGNTFMRLTFKLQTGKTLKDTQTGLRAFGNELLETMISIEGERYEYEINVLLQLARAGVPLLEVPISTIYIDSKNSNSHYASFKDSFRIGKELIKFSLSSFSSFLIDYILYSILVLILGVNYIAVANVSARIISATYNFTMNRRFVFKSNEPLLKTAVQYVCLALGVLTVNTVILSSLVQLLQTNPYTTKIIVELCMFLVSWLVQRTFIFKRTNSKQLKR